MGVYLTMSSGGGSGLEWAGSVRGVVVIIAVVRWGHGGHGVVLCYCVALGSVVSWKGFGQYLETCLQKGSSV